VQQTASLRQIWAIFCLPCLSLLCEAVFRDFSESAGFGDFRVFGFFRQGFYLSSA
jgi:hypothetical protein